MRQLCAWEANRGDQRRGKTLWLWTFYGGIRPCDTRDLLPPPYLMSFPLRLRTFQHTPQTYGDARPCNTSNLLPPPYLVSFTLRLQTFRHPRLSRWTVWGPHTYSHLHNSFLSHLCYILFNTVTLVRGLDTSVTILGYALFTTAMNFPTHTHLCNR